MSNAHSPRIVLRIIVDGSATSAETTWIQVQRALADVATVGDVTIKPYWKFEGSHEIASMLVPIVSPDAAYDAIARDLASGWTDQVEDDFARWAVWNRGTGEFIAPTVRWAHLELIRR
jgi:hypothetical protein